MCIFDPRIVQKMYGAHPDPTLHYTTLHYTSLHNTTLHYTTLHHTTLHYCSSYGSAKSVMEGMSDAVSMYTYYTLYTFYTLHYVYILHPVYVLHPTLCIHTTPCIHTLYIGQIYEEWYFYKIQGFFLKSFVQSVLKNYNL